MTDITKERMNIDEKKLSISEAVSYYAEQGKKMQFYKDDLPPDVTKTFKRFLLRIAKNLGIQNPPNDTDLNEVIKFLMRNHRDFTAGELLFAFELYAAGTLTTYEAAGKDLLIERPYGTLNLLFIGQVLNSYRAFRKRMKKPEYTPASHQLAQENAKPMAQTAEEWNELSYKIINEYAFVNHELPALASYSAAYLHLVLIGKLNLSDKEKIEFREAWRKKKLEELNRKKFTSNLFQKELIDKEIAQLMDDKSEYLIAQLREAAVREYFKTIISKLEE